MKSYKDLVYCARKMREKSVGKRFNYATIKRKLERVITMQICWNYAELLRLFTGYSVVGIVGIM